MKPFLATVGPIYKMVALNYVKAEEEELILFFKEIGDKLCSFKFLVDFIKPLLEAFGFS
jgi:hypothetical protein